MEIKAFDETVILQHIFHFWVFFICKRREHIRAAGCIRLSCHQEVPISFAHTIGLVIGLALRLVIFFHTLSLFLFPLIYLGAREELGHLLPSTMWPMPYFLKVCHIIHIDVKSKDFGTALAM